MTFLNSNMLSARTRPERFLHASCLPAWCTVRDWLPFPLHMRRPGLDRHPLLLCTMDVVASIVGFLGFYPLFHPLDSKSENCPNSPLIMKPAITISIHLRGVGCGAAATSLHYRPARYWLTFYRSHTWGGGEAGRAGAEGAKEEGLLAGNSNRRGKEDIVCPRNIEYISMGCKQGRCETSISTMT